MSENTEWFCKVFGSHNKKLLYTTTLTGTITPTNNGAVRFAVLAAQLCERSIDKGCEDAHWHVELIPLDRTATTHRSALTGCLQYEYHQVVLAREMTFTAYNHRTYQRDVEQAT